MQLSRASRFALRLAVTQQYFCYCCKTLQIAILCKITFLISFCLLISKLPKIPSWLEDSAVIAV
ncbi:Protein of unknown function [Gryllus bimaculatus]|nr:Protein of unknown function [Gryllus bimaculatus]